MLKTKQNQRNIFTFVKLILFVGVLGVIYWQVRHFKADAWQEFQLLRPTSLLIAVFLVFTNIWIAYLKWKVTLNVVVPGTLPQKMRQSFFAGIVTGMLTPNMIGNFIGRFYYFERSKRTGIILFTLLSNYAQFVATITFGWIAILLAGEFYALSGPKTILVWLGVGVIVSYLIYFFIDNFLHRVRKKGYFKDFHESLRKHRTYRLRILGLSMARFAVFTLQFSLVLDAFGESMSLTSVMAIWQVYLITMLFPSLFLGKVGVRESIAVFVLSSIGMNEVAVLFTSFIIWVINSLSPALVGLMICKKPDSDV